MKLERLNLKMIKRIIPFILILSLILSLAFTPQVVDNSYADEDYVWADVSVIVSGERLYLPNQCPVIVGGRTLVPVRGVFEHIGFKVDWDPVSRQVTLTSSDYLVILTIGSAYFTTNGVTHTLDVPARIINDRTMIPIRAVIESVGYYVSWDSLMHDVLISRNPISYVMIRDQKFSTATWSIVLRNRLLTSEEIAPLSHMTYLRQLDLWGNEITELSPLAGLTSLEFLELGLNQISDLTPLSEMQNLWSLRLSHNKINDVSPLANFTNDLRFLLLEGNPITDWSPVAHIEGVSGRPEN